MNVIRIKLLLGLVCLVVGCMASPGAAPALGDVTTLSAERTIPGVTLEPPTTLAAAVQAGDAFAVCTSGVTVCPDGTATAELAIATDSGSGSVDKAGKETLLMDHRLVWDLSWSDVQCVHSGPPPPSGEEQKAPGPVACEVVVFVDAATGAFIYKLSYADPT